MVSYVGNAFPKSLTAEEETELLAEMELGSVDAKNTLIERNLRLVAHIVKKYNGTDDNEELISIGTIGLIKAVSTYKVNKGYKLGTYAARCIENEILMYLRKLKKRQNDVSLQDYMSTDKDGNQVSLEEKIADEGMSIEDIVGMKSELKEVAERIKTNLSDREREIILMRYGLGCNAKTQQEIADIFGISRSYVSRIEKAALSKLRK
jgi:RNA polymerase sigma-28 factor